MNKSKAILLLDDGRVFKGNSFGHYGETIGEVCFNTGMSGYQEILTDPSYCKQIVTMTAPHNGNYGVNNEDVVEDLEGQVSRMLEFIGIPFEEECISFYKTDRSVRTASSEQVRKPVNKDGMERWKPYAKYLKPLLNVLDEDLLKPEDVAYINK